MQGTVKLFIPTTLPNSRLQYMQCGCSGLASTAMYTACCIYVYSCVVVDAINVWRNGVQLMRLAIEAHVPFSRQHERTVIFFAETPISRRL